MQEGKEHSRRECVASYRSDDEQNGVGWKSGEQYSNKTEIFCSALFLCILWIISLFFLHPVNPPPPPFGNEWVSKST